MNGICAFSPVFLIVTFLSSRVTGYTNEKAKGIPSMQMQFALSFRSKARILGFILRDFSMGEVPNECHPKILL